VAAQGNSREFVVRVLAYLAFGAALWLKFLATHIVQLRAVAVVFVVLIMFTNYYCGRLLWARGRFPRQKNPKLVARATGTYVLGLGVFGIVLSDIESAIVAMRLFQGMGVSAGVATGAWLGGFIGFLFSWAASYELRITNETIDYFSLLGGHRSLNLRDIDHARIRVGPFELLDRLRPTPHLEIVPRDSGDLLPVVINLKVFRKPDLERVFEWLGEKLERN